MLLRPAVRRQSVSQQSAGRLLGAALGDDGVRGWAGVDHVVGQGGVQVAGVGDWGRAERRALVLAVRKGQPEGALGFPAAAQCPDS